MTDLRADLREKFRAILDESMATMPEQIPVGVPIGRLADAAAELMTNAPRVPAYDPEVTPRQTFCSKLSNDEIEDGRTFDKAWVTVNEAEQVVLCGFDGVSRFVTHVRLAEDDAEAFALAILATARHVRDLSKITSD